MQFSNYSYYHKINQKNCLNVIKNLTTFTKISGFFRIFKCFMAIFINSFEPRNFSSYSFDREGNFLSLLEIEIQKYLFFDRLYG